MSSLKIGWAKVDITPIPVLAKKVSLIGQFHERIAEKVRDPIYVTVMVLDDEKSLPSIIISADLVMITKELMDEVRKELKALLPDMPPAALLISATHIHTGPYINGLDIWGKRFSFSCKDPEVLTPDTFRDFFAEKTAVAAAEAWRSRKTGGIALKLGRIAVPQCRRVQYKDGTSQMYGATDTPDFLRVEGNADNGAEYLITYDTDGKITGLIINLACPAQIVEMEQYITADLWGEVREQMGEIPYVLPLCGAAGDLAMRDLVRRDRTEASTRSEEGIYEIAGRITRESKFIISTVKKEEILFDIPYQHLFRNIQLPLRAVTEEDYIQAERDLSALEADYEQNALEKESPDSYPLRMKDRVEYTKLAAIVERNKMQKKDRNISMELHAVRVGNAVLVSNPFELYQEYGNQIKALSPAPYTFVAQLSCDCLGYLPNELAITGGGYSTEVADSYVGPEGGDVLVAKTLDAILTVWSGPK